MRTGQPIPPLTIPDAERETSIASTDSNCPYQFGVRVQVCRDPESSPCVLDL
jgi:hypothetical protein